MQFNEQITIVTNYIYIDHKYAAKIDIPRTDENLLLTIQISHGLFVSGVWNDGLQQE